MDLHGFTHGYWILKTEKLVATGLRWGLDASHKMLDQVFMFAAILAERSSILLRPQAF